MSRTLFCRPSYLHAASRVSSASGELGLMVGAPAAVTGNDGALVLRSSGTPFSAVSLVARLHTGGNPTGYAIPGVAGRARGAGLTWRNAADATTLYRGYTDTPYLVRVAHPLAYNAGHGPPSTPRELANGNLGILVSTSTTSHTFRRVTSSWGALSTVTVSTLTLPSAAYRPDFVVLPSGRLVAGIPGQGGQDGIQTYYSDDHGATWAELGYSAAGIGGAARAILCMEAVGDDIVAILASATGATTTRVLVSHDGGATFASVDTGTTLANPRTCVRDGVVIATHRSGVALRVYHLAPGGGFGAEVVTSAGCFGDVHCIASRPDGVLWGFGWEASGGNGLDMEITASLDGGVTWADPTADPVVDLEQAAYGTDGLSDVSAGAWRGAIIVVGRVTSNAGSDGGLHFLQFGEWANVTDGFGGATAPEVYQHSYIGIDYPQNVGWTRADIGAGATLTNEPYLKIVGTAAVNSLFTSSAAWWSTGTGDARKARFRCRVNSGGSVGDDRSRLRIQMDDGVNVQRVELRVSTTTARLQDNTGATLVSDATIDLTGWVDFIIAFAHDAPVAGAGRVSAWYKTDAAATYTQWASDVSVPELAATVGDNLSFGGATAAAVDWDIAYIGATESAEGQHNGFTNPTDLSPWPLSSSYDVPTSENVRVGGRNGGGIPGDTYTVATTYSRGKEQVWRELRPSRYWATTDSGAATLVLDAGAGNAWDLQVIALLGTNYRTATLEANATDAWGAPSFSVGLDATAWAGLSSSATRGPGYIGPAAAPGWRAGQYRSDGDAHRWFLAVAAYGEVAAAVYEVSDNDDGRVYVEDVDFSAVPNGTAIHVFADRMAVQVPRANFRFARLSIASQKTADGEYRTGTLVLDRPFDLSVLYEHGFADRMEPRVTLTEVPAGYRSALREGPRRHVLACQWGPIDRGVDDFDLALVDFFAALEGQPFLLWRDTRDATAVGLYQYTGAVALPNLWGEHEDNLGRVEQVVLEEVW